MSSLWQEAFDEASQCTYYYHVETGETSWTLPQDDGQLEEDLSFMAFAVVRLQARLRGQRDRRRVARLLRARYVTTEDPATQQTLYTDRRTGGSSWTPPALFARLGVGDAHGRDDEDEDEELDFDAFHAEEADDNAEDTTANEANGAGSGDEEQDGEDDEDPRRARKKKRKFPRSAAQLRVDEAEDLEDAALVLDLSGLNAWRLSSRIWNLATLTRLSLARNQLTRVPSGIQDLIRLEHLDLSHNHLTRLPSCLQTTTTLTFLDASHNRIASFSPRLWKLRGLQELHLAWNSLHELPYVEGDLKLLRDTREWEVGVGLLTQLRVLDLGHNRLTSVPTSIEKCVALTLLDLSHNRLTSLTDELCEAEALTELHVGANVLAELPEALGSLSNLARLNVESNRLTLLPESIGNLQRLEEIDLRRNQIHQLPQEFGALGQLRRIYLDENANLATLPTCLRFLPSVECFSASKCGLVAMDAVDLLSKAPLSLLRLSDNAFIDFPLDLRRSAMKTTLQDLDLARNSLHAFPLEVVETPCASLVRLDLSHNRLREIPSEISKLRSLRSLVLSHNYLGPALPEAVAWLPQLLELRCDHNQLTRLPLAIGILKKLEHVGAEFNQIQELPTSFLDLADSLRSLHVNDNHLAREPPVVSLLSPSCFVDLSNNPFCVDSDDGPKLQQQVQDVYAAAAKRFAEGAFGEAEELVTTSLALLEGNHGAGWWKVRQHQLPAQLYLRALCRFMTLKHARTVVEEVTEVIEECEQLLRGAQFVRLRPAYRPPKQKSLLKRGSGNQTDENTDENPASEGDLRAIQKRVSAVSNQSEHEDSIHERLSTAQGERAGARTAAAAAVEGALGDLGRAIRLGIPELATAYCLQGHLHMATLEFALAIESFTLALAASGNSENLTPTGTSIVMARAEAYRLLGQLPAALDDVQRVLDSRPADAPAYVQAKAEALAREWARHQSQYFVDHEGLFRAFDVAPTSGLARRPEVHDVHAILTADQKRGLQCTPGERFDASVAAVTRDMEQAKQKTRRAMQASYDQKAVTLRRARDFKREIRENLAMEMEERTQRIVEAELARIAELKRQEMDREFNERMFMKYEDEYMKWLVGEEMRLDAERKRREEEARRRAEAKAQYEMRLARRGGRRQQLASRGAAARKPSVARSPSPPRGGR